jgi:KTSC domain
VAAWVVFGAFVSPVVFADEVVYVKYRGTVDLGPFACEWISNSSVVKRICFDPVERYVIVDLTGTYYHYCQVEPMVVRAWLNAASLGRYYNANIKGNYDCRVLRMPEYRK